MLAMVMGMHTAAPIPHVIDALICQFWRQGTSYPNALSFIKKWRALPDHREGADLLSCMSC